MLMNRIKPAQKRDDETMEAYVIRLIREEERLNCIKAIEQYGVLAPFRRSVLGLVPFEFSRGPF